MKKRYSLDWVMSRWPASRTACNLDEAGQVTWSWLVEAGVHFLTSNLCYNRWRYFMTFCVVTMLLRPFFRNISYTCHSLATFWLNDFWYLFKCGRRNDTRITYLTYIFFWDERNFIHETLARPGNVFIDRETFKTIPRCLSSMFMRF